MAKDKGKDQGQAEKAKKPKKAKAEVSETAIRISAHPRATYSITRLKGYGGLFGLLLVGLLSWRGGLPPVDAALRGLAGGVVAYLVCWALAVQVWRHLVMAEAAAAAEVVRKRREAALAALEGADA
ncbi:MAG TPA: hypothetical protein VHF51_18205 [Solirubrobacteraceae bacterium]|nr:hypothetical protein [Solirubrobacteraceae bacterium]